MAGKNTAAFGIYPNKVALEEGLSLFAKPIFALKMFRSFILTTKGQKILAMKKRRKPLKELQQAPAQAR